MIYKLYIKENEVVQLELRDGVGGEGEGEVEQLAGMQVELEPGGGHGPGKPPPWAASLLQRRSVHLGKLRSALQVSIF